MNSSKDFVDKRSGMTFRSNTDNDHYNILSTQGLYEHSLIMWCEQFLKQDGVFIDVGAHMGAYSIILSKKCKTVHSFEPQTLTYNNLNYGVKVNNCDNIITHHCALSSDNRKGKIYQISYDCNESTINPLIAERCSTISEDDIEIKTLDSFNIENVCLLKINVEGHELEVIKGAQNTLKNSNYPPIVFECWPSHRYESKRNDVMNYLTSIGYKIIPISRTNNMFIASY